MKIRNATFEDKEGVIRLVKVRDYNYSPNYKKYISLWEKMIDSWIKKTFVVEIDGKIVAYTFYNLRRDSIYLADLYVLPKYREKKIATKLIKKVENLQKKLGKKYLQTDVNEKNIPAKKLYEKTKFKIIKRSGGDLRLRK